MTRCSGAGSDGEHCCYIEGEVCEFLDVVSVRCTIWHVFDRDNPDEVSRLAWKRAPVGGFFARMYPGFTCRDWPQNIPAAMAGTGRCCWERD